MEVELVQLAAAVATTVAGTIGNDAYTALKARVGAFLRRGGREREDAFLGELEELRSDLILARERGDETGAAGSAAAIERLVSGELGQLLTEQPSLSRELGDLHTEVGSVVTNGTLVVGGHTNVSNVFNHYYDRGPSARSQAVPVASTPLPRIALWPTDHYENNADLLLRMDDVWAERRAARISTTIYLLGVPGIGTSAVAREWLRRHQSQLTGPQLQASLGRDTWGRLPESSAILERWFRELGVPAEDVPADPGERSKYFRRLAARGPIVVLLEDVVVASQVEPLLPDTPGSVVLITSHSRLPQLVRTVRAEPFAMAPLDPIHSRKLLVSVSGIKGNVASHGKELDLITDGCRGLPLALCIAGAQLAVGHAGRIRELAAELSDRTTRLEALNMDDEISAALDPGYRGLAPEATRLYRYIGLHPAEEFEVDVVRAMLPDMDTAARNKVLRQLTAANLIEPTESGGYRVCHHLIHDHALACALADEPAEVRETVLDRIIAHYLEFVERAEAALSSRYRHDQAGTYAAYVPTGTVDAPAVVASLERRQASLENVVRLAHEKGRHDQTWRLAQGLHSFYLKCGLHSPWITTHELGLKSAHECRDQLAIVRMYFELGFAHLDRWSTRQGDAQIARGYFERALELVRPDDGNATEGQRRTESSVLEGLGLVERKLGNPAAALANYALGLEALDGIDHERGRALFALHRGVAHTDLRCHDEAARELLSARARFADLPVPDPYNVARALTRYAEDRHVAEQLDEAVRALDDAIEIMTENGPPYQRAGILLLRGDLLSKQGEHGRATLDWVTARDLFREANSLRAQEADQRLADGSGAGNEDGSQDGDVE
ncbi:hypothetical protein ACWGBX_24675 [Streptomyces sp. NPDC055037]